MIESYTDRLLAQGSGNFGREMSNTELIAHSVKSATSSGASKPTVPAARSASATLGGTFIHLTEAQLQMTAHAMGFIHSKYIE